MKNLTNDPVFSNCLILWSSKEFPGHIFSKISQNFFSISLCSLVFSSCLLAMFKEDFLMCSNSNNLQASNYQELRLLF